MFFSQHTLIYAKTILLSYDYFINIFNPFNLIFNLLYFKI